MNQQLSIRVGELRPSQLLWSFGCGSIVDLPQFSVVVMGLNHWNTATCLPIGEERLLIAVRRFLGPNVARLLGAPLPPGGGGPFDPYSAEAHIGVPVSPFPRWLRCPLCQRMAEVDSGLFERVSDPRRPDRARFVHANCEQSHGGRAPTTVPARFLVACRGGHLDDFPWHFFVHRGPSGCPGPLRFFEQGASLQTENLWVGCTRCQASRPMSEAFGERGERALPKCRGHHPHLRTTDNECRERLRAVLLGASNSWFPVSMTVLSIPTGRGRLEQLLRDNWHLLSSIPSRAVLPHVLGALVAAGQLPGIADADEDEVWALIVKIRTDTGEDTTSDLKGPEWNVFTDPNPPQDWPDFMVTREDAPDGFADVIDYVVLCERLREVNALVGFTRVEPPEEMSGSEDPPTRAPLTAGTVEWVPATEVRGEGIFLHFNTERLGHWLARTRVQERTQQLFAGHCAFRAARRLDPPDARFPGALYILLHSFAHILIRELALECGYSAASVRERIYASPHGHAAEVAGVLIYTAAPDSDGTLGGLVELGRSQNLGPLIARALRRAAICASDPLCAEHAPGAHDRSLHGAACHACSFVAETSCETGNRYLDRTFIVPTTGQEGLAFFEETK